MLHEALDGAALAGGIAPLEEHHDALSVRANPILGLQQFHLQRGHLCEIGAFRKAIGVRVGACFERATHGVGVRLELAQGLFSFGFGRAACCGRLLLAGQRRRSLGDGHRAINRLFDRDRWQHCRVIKDVCHGDRSILWRMKPGWSMLCRQETAVH